MSCTQRLEAHNRRDFALGKLNYEREPYGPVPKYIFVTGGVMSGLGKGITTSSLAKILQRSGLTVTCMKVDPYLNFDAATMNPNPHPQVFVTHDGAHASLALRN